MQLVCLGNTFKYVTASLCAHSAGVSALNSFRVGHTPKRFVCDASPLVNGAR